MPLRTGRGAAAPLFALFLFVAPAWAGAPILENAAEQGGLVVGRAAPGDRLDLDGTEVPVDAAGRFVLGFGRDAAARATLTSVTKTGEKAVVTIAVAPRDWPVQRIDGLPRDKVTPPPGVIARIKADSRAVADTRKIRRAKADFLSGFMLPVQGVVSGVFGSQRVLNGLPKAAHSGLDIAAPTGTPVVAAADGVVSLVHPDMFYTGRTVMIDHGLGVQTVYAHLSRIDVAVGQRVARGTTIGAVGASGRATGPHLHWGVSWLDRRLDPARLPTVLPPR